MRSYFSGVSWWLAALLLLLAPTSALAAEAQTGPLELKADLGIYTLIAFVILVIILTKTAWKPMLEAVEARERAIRASVDQAREHEEKARELLRSYEEKLQNAESEVRKMLEEARRQAERVQQEMLAQAREQAEQLRQQAEEEIARAKDAALQELVEKTAELVAEAAARILPRQLTEEDHRQLVRQALEELPNLR